MEENVKAPFWKPALIYGAIVGFVGILLSLVTYFIGAIGDSWVSWVSLVVSVGLLVYCLIAYRNEYLGGFASFGKLFAMAVAIGFVSSALTAVYTYLLYSVIDTGLLEQTRLMAEEKIMNNPRIPENMYDSIFERMEKRLTVGRMTSMALIWGTVVTALIGLIVSAFVKREETPVAM